MKITAIDDTHSLSTLLPDMHIPIRSLPIITPLIPINTKTFYNAISSAVSIKHTFCVQHNDPNQQNLNVEMGCIVHPTDVE